MKKAREIIKRCINERPNIVERRKRIGDWEGDTIVGGERTTAILTHVDRMSGYLLADKLEKTYAEYVRKITVKRFNSIPLHYRLTVIYDNGYSFAEHSITERETNITVYFAHPYHSWERGTNENGNGLTINGNVKFATSRNTAPEIAEKVTELAEQKNWQEAIDTYSNSIGKYTLGYITNEARADWHILLPLNPEATVLDIGSGWGNIAISLSRWCKKVYCGDVNMINLRLLRTRLRDRKIKNVSLFQYEPNTMLRLPFKDSSIDVVLLNGVLEWMGAAEIDAAPQKIQLKALMEIKRVLKSGGALYIGIENRCSLALAFA